METLPKKWHVIPRNEEQDKIFSKWRGGTHGGELHETALTSDRMWNWLRNVDSDSVELTFYQFKKLVMKEELTKLPDNWFIRGGTKGLPEILKTDNSCFNGQYKGYGYYRAGQYWHTVSIGESRTKTGYTEISLDDYLRLSNINRQEQTTNQTSQNSKAMNTTAQPKDRITAHFSSDNEIVISKNGIPTVTAPVRKETITTRTIKLQSVSFGRKDKAKEKPIITTVEREVSISVIADENGELYTGYTVKNPTDKNVSDEIGKTIARNRAINPKTNLTRNESVTPDLISKWVLKGVAEHIFVKMSSGSIQLKGVK